MVHVYYGMGKGKTSTLNGSAIRAKGAGYKVLYARFLKGVKTSEDEILPSIVDKFIKVQSSPKFVIQMSEEEKNLTSRETKKTLDDIKNISQDYDFVILDELLDLFVDNVSLVTENDIIEFIKSLGDKEILISGHYLTEGIETSADLITKFEPQKHYFEKGIKARKGVEF